MHTPPLNCITWSNGENAQKMAPGRGGCRLGASSGEGGGARTPPSQEREGGGSKGVPLPLLHFSRTSLIRWAVQLRNQLWKECSPAANIEPPGSYLGYPRAGFSVYKGCIETTTLANARWGGKMVVEGSPNTDANLTWLIHRSKSCGRLVHFTKHNDKEKSMVAREAVTVCGATEAFQSQVHSPQKVSKDGPGHVPMEGSAMCRNTHGEKARDSPQMFECTESP